MAARTDPDFGVRPGNSPPHLLGMIYAFDDASRRTGHALGIENQSASADEPSRHSEPRMA